MKRLILHAAVSVLTWLERVSLGAHDAIVPVNDRLRAALEAENLRQRGGNL